jgi:hypothetical protein
LIDLRYSTISSIGVLSYVPKYPANEKVVAAVATLLRADG